ncbi:unnamed protein product [Prorocentrum cordatum]|uniref:Guanylate cyclase domain-containing protein n=1 Tax=Prorocentrum cordatum TaxID=2364126 RepID=A0ABN9WPX9_9DINO|nr:unnamed protein product [Polarella glacialis]
MFFPVYALAITAYEFPCRYASIFLVLTMVLMWCVHETVRSLSALPLEFGQNVMVYYAMVIVIEAYCQEALYRGQYKASSRVEFTLDRIHGTLTALMPPEVVSELRVATGAVTHSYTAVTLVQSDLAGFTRFASTLEPAKVVEFVSELFGRFDKLTDTFELYKVETVGDAYIAGQGGPPLTRKNSPVAVVLFAMQMVQETAKWSRKFGENIGCRVGIHTSSCVGGIVGTDMQRYHLFGELMTCLEILESTSHVGKVHASKACKDAVDEEVRKNRTTEERFKFETRTEPWLTTSKGEAHQYADISSSGAHTCFVVT